MNQYFGYILFALRYLFRYEVVRLEVRSNTGGPENNGENQIKERAGKISIVEKYSHARSQGHLTPTADRVPTGMFFVAFLKSPLMLMPAKTPVAVGKKTPKMEKKVCPSW